jgi:hypothetical protein
MDPTNNRFYREPGIDDCLIWSLEHAAWWAPRLGGYTRSMTEARVFTRAEALRVCTAAMPGTASRTGRLPDLPVRREDAMALRTRFFGAFPDRQGHEAWQ